MASLSECKEKLRKYVILKSSLNSIISKLSFSSAIINDFSCGIRDKYTIDSNETPIVTRSFKLREEVRTTYKYLKDNVVPAIDDNISRLEDEIERLEREERERREREERERQERERQEIERARLGAN